MADPVLIEYKTKGVEGLTKAQEKLASLYDDLAKALASADKEAQKTIETQIKIQKASLESAKIQKQIADEAIAYQQKAAAAAAILAKAEKKITDDKIKAANDLAKAEKQATDARQKAATSEQKKFDAASYNTIAAAHVKVAAATDKTTTSTSRLTDRLGKLSGFGRDLRQAGSFLGNDTLVAIGGVADGFGDVAQSIDAIVKQKGGLGSALKMAGVALGGIALGAAAYDATIGKLQGGNTTGNILDQLGKFAGAGFNQEQLANNMIGELTQMRIQAELIQVNADNAVFDFKTGLQKNPEALNKTIGDLLGGMSGLLGPAGGQTKRLGEAASAVSVDQATKAQGEKIAQALIDYTKRAGGIAQAFGGLQAASGKFETSKSVADQRYRNALDFIAKETTTKRIALAQQYNADTLAIDKQYYAQRSQLAQSYGIETARAEEDHQRNIRRLTQDHDKRMSKLADSRDALGLEDEMDNFKTEQQRQDEDYQVAARRRSEDYANQLRELEQAHKEQEQERKSQYAQDLIDLQTQAKAKRNAEAVEYGLLLKDIVQAFVDARNAFAAQMQATNTTTNNNSANVTQNFNGVDGGMLGQTVRSETYRAISEVFARAT